MCYVPVYPMVVGGVFRGRRELFLCVMLGRQKIEQDFGASLFAMHHSRNGVSALMLRGSGFGIWDLEHFYC